MSKSKVLEHGRNVHDGGFGITSACLSSSSFGTRAAVAGYLVYNYELHTATETYVDYKELGGSDATCVIDTGQTGWTTRDGFASRSIERMYGTWS
jgi:hypothetical protein